MSQSSLYFLFNVKQTLTINYPLIKTNNLELTLKCDRAKPGNKASRQNRTIVSHQYITYPFRLSPIFRLDKTNPDDAYLYIMNSSPGLLAGDELGISLQLAANTSLYLTDQAATKVHPMPNENSLAKTNYQIELGERANLELISEPLILFTDAALEQKIDIKIHPTAQLCLSEIIVPGRLARGEVYQFRHYHNRVRITSLTGELYVTDAMYLEGKLNPFTESSLFAAKPILASLIVIVPEVDLKLLSQQLEDVETANCADTIVASSILPHNKSLLVRALGDSTRILKKYLEYALNCVRILRDRSSLPYIPK